MENEEKIACMEVIEVVKRLPTWQKNMIPKQVMNNLENKIQNETISLQYNSYNEIILSKKAKEILVYLYREYVLVNDKGMKEALDKKLGENESILEDIKCRKVPNTVAFNKRYEGEKKEIVLKKENYNIFSRIIKKIKQIFKLR